MELRILGCSGGIGGGLSTTSLLVDDDILIDGGTGIGALSLEELGKIRHIFLTHSHLDHVAGLPMLVDTLFGVHKMPLTVHALPETIQVLSEHVFNWKVWPNFAELPDKDNPSMRYVPMQYGERVAMDGRIIQAIRANHTVPAVGYSVTTEAGSIAFSGDTAKNDSLWDSLNALSDLKLLIVECAFANQEQALSDLAKHYCPQSLALDLAKLKHTSQIAITHLKPGYEQLIMDECRAAIPDRQLTQLQDGDRFSF